MIGVLAVWGPGLIVMLADTDAGSLITAAQSGSEWGYRLVLPQVLLIPVLYVVQEMTVRLGILTKMGHGALIRQTFGRNWALLAALPLFVSGVGALFTEYAGVAGVGELFGLPRTLTVPVAAAFLVGLSMTGSYRRAERVGIALGLAELVFIPAVAMAHPDFSALGRGLGQLPLGNSSYLFLLAANVGAVIMPWMIFYQQGAVLDKGLQPADIPSERRDTAVGAVLTQLIMIAVVLAFAATVGPLPSRCDASHRRRDVLLAAALRRCHRRQGASGHGGSRSGARGSPGGVARGCLGDLGGLRVGPHAQRAARQEHGEVLSHLRLRPPPRRRHRALQLEPHPSRDRCGSHERAHVADRARFPAGSRSTGVAERAPHAQGPTPDHDGSLLRRHRFRALLGAGDAGMDLERQYRSTARARPSRRP